MIISLIRHAKVNMNWPRICNSIEFDNACKEYDLAGVFKVNVANVRSDSWQVAWKENCIEAVISGEEQSDIRYILYFDGKTDSVQLDTPTGEWK